MRRVTRNTKFVAIIKAMFSFPAARTKAITLNSIKAKENTGSQLKFHLILLFGGKIYIFTGSEICKWKLRNLK